MSDVRVWGIDLGTTYSAIARIDSYGRAEIVQNAEGQFTTPSVVLFDADEVVVGQEAKNEAVMSPDRVVEFVKRSMGEKGWTKSIDGREYRPEEISAFILRKLARDAEEQTGERVQNVVITVPAYFNDLGRAATQSAGEIAGLNVLDVLNEPTAAAIYYGELAKQEGGDLHGNILVYDLGGGTFDVTIIRLSAEGITVIVTDGNHSLGGKDWDDALLRYVAAEFAAERGIDPLDDAQSVQELRGVCENAKRSLSFRDSVRIPVSCGAERLNVEVTRGTLEQFTHNLLAQTVELTCCCLDEARERDVDVDVVLLVGGASRAPQVAHAVQEATGLVPRAFEPDFAVAKGAVIKAAWDASNDGIQVIDTAGVLSNGGPNTATGITGRASCVVNVLSHSLGTILVEPESPYDGRRVRFLIGRQSPLPASSTEEIFTVREGDGVLISVVQGEDDNPEECTLIAEQTLMFKRILPVDSPISLEYRLSTRGMLEVTAVDITDGARLDFEVDRIGLMTRAEIEEARNSLVSLSLRR